MKKTETIADYREELITYQKENDFWVKLISKKVQD